MTAWLVEWLGLFGRWVHLITGIAWIGASFYFVWLDDHLLAPEDEAAALKGVGGEVWAVHGGGFYNAQKYRVAPAFLPATLHWFYWEAYSTLLSGVFLLCLIYYAQAGIYLVSPEVAALSQPQAIAIGVAFIVGGWLVYDALCRSALARRGALLAGVLAALCALAAWALCHLFSGRGAFIHFGAMLGTIMVANVFFVIIPGQRAMVEARRAGRDPDPAQGLRGKQRSVHNTYFTLPVLFAMISNHYAMTFGAKYNWLVLVALSAAGALIRAWFVARHKRHERGGRTAPWSAIAGLAILAGTAAALAPSRTQAPGSAANISPEARFARVQAIVLNRCATCHAAVPAQPGFSAPPKGMLLDTAAALRANRAAMLPQVESHAMPIGNLTGMTESERGELLEWLHDDGGH